MQSLSQKFSLFGGGGLQNPFNLCKGRLCNIFLTSQEGCGKGGDAVGGPSMNQHQSLNLKLCEQQCLWSLFTFMVL